MAYNSAHTGPEIDAAVQMLGEVQDARNSTAADLAEVQGLFSQVEVNTNQVAANAATVDIKTTQVLASALDVEQARSDVLIAATGVTEARDEAVVSAQAAQASKAAASASEAASSQSQLAAELSEQVSSDNAAQTAADRENVQALASQVQTGSAAAQASAESAAQSAQTAKARIDGFGFQHFDTYADLLASPQIKDTVVAIVDKDPNKKLNGWYAWSLAAAKWAPLSDQPAKTSDVSSVGNRTSVLEAYAVLGLKISDPRFLWTSPTDMYGRVSFGTRRDGTGYVGGLSEVVDDLNARAVKVTPFEDTFNFIWTGPTDKNGRSPLGITPDGLVFANTVPESVSPVSTFINRPPVVSGRKLALSACRLRYGEQHYQLTDLTVLPAADVVESVKDYPLTYLGAISMPITEFLKVDAAPWLGYSSVTISSVINQANGQVLVPGVDYAWTENGKLARINSGAALTVTVNFTGHKERYDLVAYNLNTRGLVIRQGAERRITAHEDAYRPKPLNGDIALYMVYIIGGTVRDVIDVSGWRGKRHRSTGAELARIIQENQNRLIKFRLKLLRREPVIVTGYGDSNTALGGERGTDAAYLPNRPGVDTQAFQGPYMLSDFEADWRAAYLETVGKVTVGGQIRYKTSPNWSVIDRICSVYGYSFVADRLPVGQEIVYLNQGIATTTAAATGQNGLNPTRLAAAINPAGYRTPDLVILAFGMNDRIDTAYTSNIEQIAAAFKAAGADVLLVGPHQVNPFSASFTEETWHLIHRRLQETADRLELAYVPAELFYMGKSRGYLGISDYSLTRANFANHPGPYEYRMHGEAMANSFI